MTTPAKPSAVPGSQHETLRWHAHKVRRVAFTTADLTTVIKKLVSAGAYDLKLYVWMVASMQWQPGLAGRDGAAVVQQTFRSLARCIDMPMPSTPGTLSSRMHKMVSRLVARKLVITNRIPGRGLIINLLRADGSMQPYQPPNFKGRGVGKVFLPDQFFGNGWHAVLSKDALALLLAGCVEETKQWGTFGAQGRPGAWRMSRDAIERAYGIHHDAVDAAKKELAQYGLLRYEFDELNDDERFFNNAPSHTYWIDKSVWERTPEAAPRYRVTYSRDVIIEGKTKRWMRLNQPHFIPIKPRGGKVLSLPKKGRA